MQNLEESRSAQASCARHHRRSSCASRSADGDASRWPETSSVGNECGYRAVRYFRTPDTTILLSVTTQPPLWP
jgi:hypothetical protein